MWSLYADRSQGLILRLECLEESAWSSARPVAYVAEPPVVAGREAWIRHFLGEEELALSQIAETIVFTKSDHWRDQREWRCWRRGEGPLPEGAPLHDFVPVDPREIGAVYFGPRIADAARQDLFRVLVGPLAHVEIWQARPRRGAYGVDYERLR